MLLAKYAFPVLVLLVSFAQGKASSKGTFPAMNLPPSLTLSGTYGIPSIDNTGNHYI